MSKGKKRLLIWLSSIIGVIVLALFGAGMYFYHVAVVPAHKDFLGGTEKLQPTDIRYQYANWFNHTKKDVWHETAAGADLDLDADYLPAGQHTKKTVVVVHGYMGKKEDMATYAGMFHKMGYNVLVPDLRAQGKSEGHAIGYGWPDRLDVLKWVNQIINKQGKDSQIALFGVSMGAATTMMVSGENTPSQLKGYVEDCGYTSAYDEIAYQAHQLYHLPTMPLVPIVSGITKVHAGYTFGEASALNQVKHNKKPMLFIHGTKDKFVPTKMVYPLYEASQGKKQLMLVKGAGHAASFKQNPEHYQQVVKKFVQQNIFN